MKLPLAIGMLLWYVGIMAQSTTVSSVSGQDHYGGALSGLTVVNDSTVAVSGAWIATPDPRKKAIDSRDFIALLDRRTLKERLIVPATGALLGAGLITLPEGSGVLRYDVDRGTGERHVSVSYFDPVTLEVLRTHEWVSDTVPLKRAKATASVPSDGRGWLEIPGGEHVRSFFTLTTPSGNQVLSYPIGWSEKRSSGTMAEPVSTLEYFALNSDGGLAWHRPLQLSHNDPFALFMDDVADDQGHVLALTLRSQSPKKHYAQLYRLSAMGQEDDTLVLGNGRLVLDGKLCIGNDGTVRIAGFYSDPAQDAKEVRGVYFAEVVDGRVGSPVVTELASPDKERKQSFPGDLFMNPWKGKSDEVLVRTVGFHTLSDGRFVLVVESSARPGANSFRMADRSGDIYLFGFTGTGALELVATYPRSVIGTIERCQSYAIGDRIFLLLPEDPERFKVRLDAKGKVNESRHSRQCLVTCDRMGPLECDPLFTDNDLVIGIHRIWKAEGVAGLELYELAKPRGTPMFANYALGSIKVDHQP